MPNPNIIVIVLDTGRIDQVSDQSVMPKFYDLMQESTVYTNCFANAPWTLPSHSSIFTGKRPTDHGVIGKGDLFEDESNLASKLSINNYETANFSNNPWISPDFGFDFFNKFFPGWKRFLRGSDISSVSQVEGLFSQLKVLSTKLLDLNAPFTLANALHMRFANKRDSGAKLTTERLFDWISERESSSPFFAFINFMEPHLEYSPPTDYAEKFLPPDVEYSESIRVNQDPWAYLVGEEEMDERDFEILKALYKAELHYLDDYIGDIISFLRKEELLNETALFILGDHGENIGDHGLMDHQYSLRDSLLHVPLLARLPGRFNPGEKVEQIVELRDLYPTILDIAGVKMSESDTRSTLSLPTTTGREFAVSEYPTPQPAISVLRDRYNVSRELTVYDRRLRSIRTKKWRYVMSDNGQNRLYDVGNPMNGKVSDPEIASKLEDQLVNELGSLENTSSTDCMKELPDESIDRLEDLGYI